MSAEERCKLWIWGIQGFRAEEIRVVFDLTISA